jgi:peptidoglycan hydrolase-like amidase
MMVGLLALAATVQIGVFGLFHPQRLVVKAPAGSVLRVQAGNQHTILEGGRSAGLVRFGDQIDWLHRGELQSAKEFEITARDGGETRVVLGIEGRIEREFFGKLRVSVGDGSLLAVVAMNREQAVAAAVAAEYGERVPLEALKALAVLARSHYAAGLKRHAGFDFCDTTHCQFHRSPPPPNSRAWAAVKATEGQQLEWHGRMFAPLYFGSCDGQTRTAAGVGLQSEGYPYYVVACSRHEPSGWTAQIGDAKLDGSEKSRLDANRKLGKWPIKSNAYVVTNGTASGKGEGHLVGMCQRGAAEMAREGKTYRDILSYYYPGTSITRRED